MDRSITIICLTQASRDSRLQRHIRFFVESGFLVSVVSLKDESPKARPGGVNYFELEGCISGLWHDPVSHVSWGKKRNGPPGNFTKLYRYARLAALPKSGGWAAQYYKNRLKIYPEFRTLSGSLPSTDLIFANDWDTLPLACELGKMWDSKIVYDSHELASEQFIDAWDWRTFVRPIVKAIEKTHVPRVDVVSAVSSGICDFLQRTYRLTEAPTLLRNIPATSFVTEALEPRKSADAKFLYLGNIAPRRGLERLVESLPFWSGDQSLTLMGPVTDERFAANLLAQAEALGVSDKLSLHPRVPPDQVVQAARDFDVGLLILPTDIRQNQWAMPNKFFEYARAGLYVLSTPLKEIASLIGSHDFGAIVPYSNGQALGDAIASISDDEIDAGKQAASKFGAELDWRDDYRALLSRLGYHPAEPA